MFQRFLNLFKRKTAVRRVEELLGIPEVDYQSIGAQLADEIMEDMRLSSEQLQYLVYGCAIVVKKL